MKEMYGMIEHNHGIHLHDGILPPVCNKCGKLSEHTCAYRLQRIWCLQCCDSFTSFTNVINDSSTIILSDDFINIFSRNVYQSLLADVRRDFEFTQTPHSGE